jgi:hypothetical protein
VALCTSGTGWISRLLETGEAELLSLNCGYPNRYTVTAGAVLPKMTPDPPPQDSPLVLERDWVTLHYINREAMGRFAAEDKLLVTVGDES